MSMKRIAGLLLGAIGIACAVFGIVRGATAEDTTVVEVTIPGGQAQMMYTAPGVLHLVDDTVDVTLSAPEGKIHWGLGATQDVEDFIGESAAIKVTGLSDWQTPAYEELPGTPEGIEPIAEAAAQESWGIEHMDLWFESGTGEQSVELPLEPDQSIQLSLIVSTTTGKAPDMTLAWEHSLPGANARQIVVIGLLIALIGLLLWIGSRQETSLNRKIAAKRHERRERQEAQTTVMQKIERSRDEAKRTTGGALGAGIMPGVNESLRDRALQDSDRIVLPAIEEDSELDEQVAAEEEPEVQEAGPAESSKDEVATDKGVDDKEWRALWNFSWGTPWTKEEDEDA
ncbi:hypothetical protein J2S70_001345 [Trueperella bonasi]|uniref:Uncharacterized protein n=1 Tax=Trueperella bonasi TaxID=312286 RepID=A0ABT9NIW7_9ACTO|nr:hypothetical protein [Trueperella bonasi]MDP9806763.1 hypothetical protein [Trueperella bonasi]